MLFVFQFYLLVFALSIIVYDILQLPKFIAAIAGSDYVGLELYILYQHFLHPKFQKIIDKLIKV